MHVGGVERSVVVVVKVAAESAAERETLAGDVVENDTLAAKRVVVTSHPRHHLPLDLPLAVILLLLPGKRGLEKRQNQKIQLV